MKKLKKTSDEELLNLYQSNSEENLLSSTYKCNFLGADNKQ